MFLYKSSNWLGFSCVMRYLWSLQPLGFRNRTSLLLIFLFSPFLLEQWKMWIPGNLFSFLIFHFFFSGTLCFDSFEQKIDFRTKGLFVSFQWSLHLVGYYVGCLWQTALTFAWVSLQDMDISHVLVLLADVKLRLLPGWVTARNIPGCWLVFSCLRFSISFL